MSTVRNTSKADPMENFLATMGGIEAQEAQGQRELVASTVLPTDTNFDSDADFEALGFTFGKVVDGDPLFREATLPDGWTRKGSDHAMWSHIVDERGVARVAVFYKAAFYDRKAHMDIVNVGRNAATEWIYGDGEPTLRDDLTVEELQQVKVGAERYLEDVERHPDIYKEGASAKALLERLAEVQS